MIPRNDLESLIQAGEGLATVARKAGSSAWAQACLSHWQQVKTAVLDRAVQTEQKQPVKSKYESVSHLAARATRLPEQAQ